MDELTWHVVEGLPESPHRESLLALNGRVFEGTDTSYVTGGLLRRQGVTVTYAARGDEVAGYKIGFEQKPGRYYSWLGGVDPGLRRQGIARRLMELQHDWCLRNGYSTVRTRTKNTWRAMLILNLQMGFDIIGTLTDAHGEPKIILEKQLTNP